VELPVGRPAPVLALVMSGDGNWASFVKEVADTLVDRGIPVVGLKSRSYLSEVRTPEGLARDMSRVLRYYLRAWSAQEFLVVGYSRGADFAPFLVNRLPADLRARIRGVALLSPTKMASFEFHLIDLIHFVHRPSDLSAISEVDAMAPCPILCAYGLKDQNALCPLLPEGAAELVPLDDGHRLHGAGTLVELLLDRVGLVKGVGGP
jgi:type IV secretory pathway VirJ component